MKHCAYILFLVLTAIGAPIKPDSITALHQFGTAVLSSGKADLTINDSGASILLESGKLWVTGRGQKVHVFVSEGIATLSGTVLIETDSVGTRFRTITGFTQLLETGGFPGEILPQGYERRLYRSGSKDTRRLITEDLLKQFCDSFPGNHSFGCPALIDTTTPIVPPTDDTVLTKAIIIIHPIANDSALFARIPSRIQAELIKREPKTQVTAVSEINYKKHWEYTSNGTMQYVVIDGMLPRKMPDQKEQQIQFSFFDSRSASERRFLLPVPDKMSDATVESMVQEIAVRLVAFLKEVTAEPVDLP